MEHRFAIRVLEVSLNICIESDRDSRADLELVADAWDWCTTPPHDESVHTIEFVVNENTEVLNRRRERGAFVFPTLEMCQSQMPGIITNAAIDNAPGSLLLLHAGAVAHPISGAVIGLMGISGAGKTTATRMLAQTLGYVTDETLAVNVDDFSVVAYPKPLAIVNVDRPYLKHQRGPTELGLTTSVKKLWLAQILVVNRVPSHAGEPVISDLTPLEVLRYVVPQVSNLARRSRPVRDLLRVLNLGAGIQLLTYRDAADLPDFMRKRLDSYLRPDSSDQEMRWAMPSITMPPPVVVVEPAATESDVIQSTFVKDSGVLGNLTIVFSHDCVIGVDGLGSEILREASQPITLHELVEKLTFQFGLPEDGDARERIMQAVAELRGNGLLQPLQPLRSGSATTNE
jgi:hypothetical protein